MSEEKLNMRSSRTFQYGQMPGAFPDYIYTEERPFSRNQNDPLHMRSRRAFQYDQMPGAYPSNDPNEYTSTAEELFSINQNDPLPTYTYQQYPREHYIHRDINPGLSDSNVRTPSSRNEASRYGESSALSPQPWNQSIGDPRTSRWNSGHHTSSSYQPYRPEYVISQHNAYGAAYGAVNQQSPYLLHGQGTTNAGQTKTTLKPKLENQEVKQEPEKKTKRKKSGFPVIKCPTVRKILEKHGQTKVVNGQLMWLDPNEPDDKRWKPAVIMDDIRKYILRQQNREAELLGSKYLYPDPPGGERYGETAFFYPHRDLGKAREARADLVFMIEDTGQNHGQPPYDPGWMMFNPVTKEIGADGSLLVLNPADNPIVNWIEIPLCISPHMDASKMEHMRRVNRGIRHEDIWARMPRLYRERPNDPRTIKSISGTNGMVSMPAKRFRERVGCLAWTDRGGSDELELGLKNFLNSTEVGRQCLAANSMKGFGRDLDPAEILLVKRGNANGQFLKNAGNRAVDEATRKKRKAREDKRIAEALGAVNPRKRGHSDEEDDQTASNRPAAIQQRPEKRIRLACKAHRGPIEDNDLTMFDEQPLIVESQDPIERYGLRKPAKEAVNHQEHDGISTSATGIKDESNLDEDREHIEALEEEEEEGHEKDADPEDKGDKPDTTTPITIALSTITPPTIILPTTIALSTIDPLTITPPTTTPDPAPNHPPDHLSAANNAKAKESDLEAHRRSVREFLCEDQEDYATCLERQNTTQPTPRYPNAINPLEPSVTTTSGTNPSETAPSTDREVASIAVALCATKRIFWEWTGQTVPQPDREQSYGQQFRELHRAFQEWWRGKNAKGGGGPIPVLVGVRHWGSAVEDWEPVEKDAVYYEAYKKGHRAPRDEYGGILDVPGPLLEKWGDAVY